MDTFEVHQGSVVTPDGVRIVYQVCGQGPALIAGHPMACDQSLYDPHRRVFSQTHTFITFDQRGSGLSDHPPFEEGDSSFYTVERFGDDLKAVMDGLGIASAKILGFSMGAVSALSFATRWPERVDQLILVSAMASRLPQPIIDRARLVEAMLDEKSVAEVFEFYFSGSLFEGLQDQQEVQRQLESFCAKATPHGFKGCFRVTIYRPSLAEQLKIISCPTLILVGETDIHYLAEAELMEQEIGNAKRIVMAGVGHPIASQDPAAFETAVIDFITEDT